MAKITMEVTNCDLWMNWVGHYCNIHSIAHRLHSKHLHSNGGRPVPWSVIPPVQWHWVLNMFVSELFGYWCFERVMTKQNCRCVFFLFINVTSFSLYCQLSLNSIEGSHFSCLLPLWIYNCLAFEDQVQHKLPLSWWQLRQLVSVCIFILTRAVLLGTHKLSSNSLCLSLIDFLSSLSLFPPISFILLSMMCMYVWLCTHWCMCLKRAEA